jgi:hypothetical protein
MTKTFASTKNALRICQRSGFKYKYNKIIVEPGTGLWVHEDESDGRFNRVDHPQLHIKGVSDMMALEKPNPDIKDAIEYLTDEDGNYLSALGQFGAQLYLEA